MSEELFDVCDESGNPSGIIKPRSEVHAKGLWHAAVHVWILNPNNQLLIQKRSPTKESNPNLWDVSVAGHISTGESPALSAVREIKEEIGVDIDQADLQYLFTTTEQKVLNNGTYFDNEFHHIFFLKQDVDIQKLVLQPEEVVQVKWMSIDDLEKLTQTPDQTFVDHGEEYKKIYNTLIKV